MKQSERLLQVQPLWEQGLGLSEISRKLNISTGYTCILLDVLYGKIREKRHIYKRRIFTLNELFFEYINTEAKAYFLGLLAADGNLATGQNLVRIGLNEKDKEILKTFCKHLNYTRPLKFVEKSKLDWNRSNQYLIAISSTIFRKTLNKHGLTPNKSATLVFPSTIPLIYIHDYIRGYFDGDGCISVRQDNSAEISIAGSKLFCEGLIPVMNNVNISVRVSKHSTANCYYARIKGGLNIMKFYDFLYNDATIYLRRKKMIFENWKVQRYKTMKKYKV